MIEKLKNLLSRYKIRDIYAFGSRGKEVAAFFRGEIDHISESKSDVDIGIYPMPGISLGIKEKVDLISDLEDLLDVKRVDLVVLPEADPFLALEIIKGELIFSYNLDAQASYELFVLRRAGDLLPYKKERRRMILEEGAR